MKHPIKQRDPIDRCAVCNDPVSVWHVKDPLPAPELLNLPPNAWLGLASDESNAIRVVITCSYRCAQALLDAMSTGSAISFHPPRTPS
jgi:hypothetical protein